MILSRSAHFMGGAAAFLLLQACGGGGGGSPTPTPTPTVSPIKFTSAQTASVAENTSGIFYSASATGGAGAISFAIVGGADAAKFSMSATGALEFRNAPNFDLEADANGDNIYDLTIEARAGAAIATHNLLVQVTNLREGIKVTRIATGLVDPVGFARTNLAAQLIVAERGGLAYFVDGANGLRTPVPGMLPVSGNEIVDIAFGPDNSFYRGPIVLLRSATGIIAYRPNTGAFIDALLASGDTTGVQASVYFDNGGRMFIAVGDPGGTRAQADDGSVATGFGKFFVEGSPYVSASLRSIALLRAGSGIQAPAGFAEVGGELLLLDRGSTREHEVSRFNRDQRPINFGWKFFEGTVMLATPPSGLIGPSLVYPVGEKAREGKGPVGGVVYQGPIRGIMNHFVFADADGTIWSIPADQLTGSTLRQVADLERRTADFAPDQGKIDQVVDLIIDGAGTIYLLDADGEIFRVDAA